MLAFSSQVEMWPPTAPRFVTSVDPAEVSQGDSAARAINYIHEDGIPREHRRPTRAGSCVIDTSPDKHLGQLSASTAYVLEPLHTLLVHTSDC